MPDLKKQTAGRKGGQTISKNREHMAAIGRKGGKTSRGRLQLTARPKVGLQEPSALGSDGARTE